MTVHGLERDQLVSRMSVPREERESKEEQILELLGAGESFTENNKGGKSEREGTREREGGGGCRVSTEQQFPAWLSSW